MSTTRLWATIGVVLIIAGLWGCGAKAEVGVASWFGPGFHGRTMANGKRFNQNDPRLCAHKRHKFGTKIKVTDLQSGRWIICRVADRGPFIKGRIVDLSRAGAEKLGMLRKGLAKVRVDVVK